MTAHGKPATFAAMVTLLAFGLAPRGAAQVRITSRAAEIEFTGRVHAQWSTTSVPGDVDSDFQLRRIRFTAEVEIDDLITGKIQPDFGRDELVMKDVYFRLNLDPAFRMTFGQFKRPLDIFEIVSSTELVVIERTGAIRGVDSCLGPGGVCSWSRLTEKLQYSDRDMGVMVDGRPSRLFQYFLSATNGTGPNNADENGTKSYTGRAVIHPSDKVRIAGNVGVHDYFDPNLGDEYAVAFGGDVEVGSFGEPVHVQAGVLVGDNWQNLNAIGDPATFVTAQAILSYQAYLERGGHVRGIEPLVRVSWADPDTDAADADGLLITPGVALHFTGRNMLVANVDVWSPATGDTEWSLKLQSFLHF